MNAQTYPPVLSDLDGTLIDSKASVDKHWRAWASRHDLDPAQVLPYVYGHRTIDTIRHFVPLRDHVGETSRIDGEQASDTTGVRATPGAARLLALLSREWWAVVTSGAREFAIARLRAASLPAPAVFIAAEDVEEGKPSPEGYLLAATRLGVGATNCLVVEDTPSA